MFGLWFSLKVHGLQIGKSIPPTGGKKSNRLGGNIDCKGLEVSDDILEFMDLFCLLEYYNNCKDRVSTRTGSCFKGAVYTVWIFI